MKDLGEGCVKNTDIYSTLEKKHICQRAKNRPKVYLERGFKKKIFLHILETYINLFKQKKNCNSQKHIYHKVPLSLN